MLRDVLRLSCLHLLEPAVVAVDNIEAMPKLSHPEVRVSHVPCELMPVQRDELCDLDGERVGYFAGIGHVTPPWNRSQIAVKNRKGWSDSESPTTKPSLLFQHILRNEHLLVFRPG
jgi:hypothetical protein